MADDLTALALAAAGGDRAALAAFVRAGQSDVWRLARHLTDGDAADDVTQDTFLRAIAALPGYRGEALARVWLLAIARRAAADHLRAVARRRRLADRVRAARTAAAPDPTGAVTVDLLIGGLDPDRRSAFVLTQVLGLSYEEAAVVCGCPVGTIRSRVARARADLLRATAGRAVS